MTTGTSIEERHMALAEAFLGAWNTQDVESVVACYTPDVSYRDPNTRGEVIGADALRRYLAKLFGAWQMHWSLRAAPFALAGQDGTAVLWRASFRRPGGTATVEADGMDLVLLEGDLIKRNEVYFDRAVILPLMNG
jgi:ketosteroid isomerase-like protein